MPNHPRPKRIAITGARAQLASMVADVVNVSRSGALIRTPYEQRPGALWPLLLEFDDSDVQLVARVVRCEPARTPRWRARQEFAVGVEFIDPSDAARVVLDRICRNAGTAPARPRRLCVSFVRRCPNCMSRAVQKETNRRYCCVGCGQRFAGIRVGIVRFAR